MEFKIRAVHDSTSSTTTPDLQSPISTITTTCLSHQTFPVGSSTMVPTTPNLSEMLSSNNTFEALQRELVKDEIRREILTGIITRRQVLEKEVWKEMMLAMHSNLAMMLPQQPQTQPALENKDKFIKLARPDPDLYASKRKAVTPAVEKTSNEWSCELCQVNVTSEKLLNEHFQGKKHKAKEAALRTKMIGLDSKADEQSLQAAVTCEGLNKDQSDQTVVDECLLNFKNEERNQNAEDSKKQNGTATWEDQEVQNINALKRRKIVLWCEICQVRTHSQAVMEDHKKGRKHLTQMKKLDQKDKSASPMAISSTASLGTTGSIRDKDAVNPNRPRDDMCSEQRTIKMEEGFADSEKSGLSPWLNQVE